MSLGSTAQTRELTELRNHLKWLDEERRKSSRKMAELEQRLAQQGRELADRDHKIQELEWHVANFAERFEQIPDLDSNVAGTEQRLQDLEWHLSNMNAQFSRIPNMEEERAQTLEEVSRTISAIQEQMATEQSTLENRMRSEMMMLRDSEELRRVVDRQNGQDQTINELNQRIESLQETIGSLSTQLRERTDSLAMETQGNFSSLATGLQDHLDAMTEENQARINLITAELETKLAELQSSRSEALAPQVVILEERLQEQQEAMQQLELRLSEHFSQQFTEQAEQINLQFAERAERFDSQFAEIEGLRARQAEVDFTLEKLGHVSQVMPLLDRLEQELELRQAEEVRLSNLIGTQENRFEPLANSLEELKASYDALLVRAAESDAQLEEIRAGLQNIDTTLRPTVSELNRTLTPLNERFTSLSNTLAKAEVGLQTLTDDQAALREMVLNLNNDWQSRQSESERQMEIWQATLDENKDTIERFSQQWITLSNQYKEARMAVQNFAHWQKQLEQQKREASEMLRLESNRMQSRWDGFLLEIQEKLKNFEIELNQKWQSFELENEQKWAVARRNEQVRHEELAAVDELIQKLQQDNRNLIWRVQTAQADAIKKWPRLLMEEIEKAVELNPNRRLASSSAPPSDMSVVDAIEQGLITIDYSDDTPID